MKFFCQSVSHPLGDFQIQEFASNSPNFAYCWQSSAVPLRIQSDCSSPWGKPAIVEIKEIEGKNRERTRCYSSSLLIRIKTKDSRTDIKIIRRELEWISHCGKFYIHKGADSIPVAVFDAKRYWLAIATCC